MAQHMVRPDTSGPGRTELDVAVPMRDGAILRADLRLPPGPGPHPALLCRTPYGKGADPCELRLAERAVARGYAVLIQDVRGRHASEGVFEPHVHEGRDGFDTIEWIADQPWCDGRVGGFGLSYAGCAQWLAAILSPPRLLAMAPAMSNAALREAVRYGGVFDADWLRWAFVSMAPDERARRALPGARTPDEAWAEWTRTPEAELQGRLPMAEVADLALAAPYYKKWLATPASSPWWGFADLAGKYARVTAAVLHLDGWLDDACGPRGAIANHLGLCAARAGEASPRSLLVLGPWTHGVPAITEGHGVEAVTAAPWPDARLDYDALVLDFMDLHVRGLENRLAQAAPVRYFVLGANQWREAAAWPPAQPGGTDGAGAGGLALHLGHGAEGAFPGLLAPKAPDADRATAFTNDPLDPLREPPNCALRGLDPDWAWHERGRLAAFDSAPLEADLTVAGSIRAELFISADAPDVDLHVKLLDVGPDGTARFLMGCGAGVLRASLRDGGATPKPLAPGTVHALTLDSLLTANAFRKGHRIRVLVCGSWFPAMSRNLQTGESEAFASATRPARITLHHGPSHPSRVLLPVVDL